MDKSTSDFRCPDCEVTHKDVPYRSGTGDNGDKHYDGGILFSVSYMEWFCPVIGKKFTARVYWGEAFPL